MSMFGKALSTGNRISILPALFLMPAMTCLLAPRAALAATPAAGEDDQARQVFYTVSYAPATGATELFAIEVSGLKVTTTDIGPMGGGGCSGLAVSSSGTLFSMCGPLFGAQQLASIDRKTGLANVFGVPVGLAVMSIAFGPDGTLYAIGDCNPQGASFECGPGSDPNYNSLYTINEANGAFTRVGSTGAPQYFMDLTFDRDGNMFGVTTTLNPSLVPAILYRINRQTGAATKIVNLVGSNTVMGLEFGRDGKLYANDFVLSPGLYLVDPKTGFETAIAALPFPLPSSVKLADPLP
jgi:hypothetical protein